MKVFHQGDTESRRGSARTGNFGSYYWNDPPQARSMGPDRLPGCMNQFSYLKQVPVWICSRNGITTDTAPKFRRCIHSLFTFPRIPAAFSVPLCLRGELQLANPQSPHQVASALAQDRGSALPE